MVRRRAVGVDPARIAGVFSGGMSEMRWPRPTKRGSAMSSIVTGALIASLLTFWRFCEHFEYFKA